MNSRIDDHRHAKKAARAGSHGPMHWINGLAVARGHEARWLPHDVVAGVTLSAVLVPAGMAYAEAAGLPAANGLYASFAASLAYAVFGHRRILVLGPDLRDCSACRAASIRTRRIWAGAR
ncbi:hypothetical protein GCT13_22720 [Paraburkholderia sp. CNPSo 3157]|uniref:SLC26A/SulP transporter domain-containing protein n=1 Tax=Paraburkholderia franconis TaxID=2654983 RepID=A0A7X1NDN3_9BURK|nr:SulP family inorganic anion transporter [Paraburkholderia franconis]MPW19636.1 hypothetical protein [Paraburkholderia franconis]